MARIFLNLYVGLNILIIVVNLIVNATGDEMIQFLSKDDWLIFIIACGTLAIVEEMESLKERMK